MYLQSKQSTFLATMLGMLGCGIAVVLLVGSGGIAVGAALPFGLAGYYFGGRRYIDSIKLLPTELVLYTTWFFRERTQHFPRAALSTRYVANGGLRSTKHYVLEIYASSRLVAKLSLKEGFEAQQLKQLYRQLSHPDK